MNEERKKVVVAAIAAVAVMLLVPPWSEPWGTEYRFIGSPGSALHWTVLFVQVAVVILVAAAGWMVVSPLPPAEVQGPPRRLRVGDAAADGAGSDPVDGVHDRLTSYRVRR